MAVDSIHPLPGREAFFGMITEWTATRRWLVHCNTRYDEEWPILMYGVSIGTFPKPYSNVLGTNPMLLCRSLGAKQEKESPQHWIATAEYSSAPLSQQKKDEQNHQNPLDRPSKIRWNSAKYNKPCIYDTGNNLILNSAGDPFDPPAEFDRSRWTATIVKNVPDIPTYILGYTDGVNEADFTIQDLDVPQYSAKIMSIEIGEEQTAQIGENDFVTYFVFTYTLEFRPELWKLVLLDQGYRQQDPNDATKRINIKDDSVPAKDISKPWPLNGFGARLSNPSASNAKKRTFDVYQYVDYSVLPGIDGNL